MDRALKMDTYPNYHILWSGPIGGDAGSECIVPDSMPDIGSIIDAEACLSIRSKETVSGTMRASAEISVRILYQPEDGGPLQCLPVSLSCEVSAAVPNADSDCLSFVKLHIRSLEAKALNSRKISLHAELGGSAMCLQREEISLVREIGAPSLHLEILQKHKDVYRITDVKEKTFILTDDFALPAGCDAAEEILIQRVQILIDGSEFVSGKFVFRGRARVFLLLSDARQAYPCTCESEFSQVMDLGSGAGAVPEISLMLTGAYFDLPELSAGKIAAELHMLAQVLSWEKAELNYIADLYSNQKMLEPVWTESRFLSQLQEHKLTKTLAASAEIPPDAAALLYARARITGAVLRPEGVEISAGAKVIYSRLDQSCGSVNLRIKELLPVDGVQDEALFIRSVQCGECIASLAAGRVEIRVGSEVVLAVCKEETVAHVSDFSISEDKLPEVPSVTLRVVGKDSDLWSIAKMYRSSRSAIRAANDGREEGLLLIPKGR